MTSLADIKIRQATASDAEGIAARIKTQNSADEIRDQIALFASKREEERNWEHLVAVDGGEVVGNIAIIPARFFPMGSAHRGELSDIVVAPSHQGRGLLRRLVEAAAARAREMGMTQIETAAWLSNERAVRAYQGVGFIEWGRLPNAIKREDGTFDSLVCFVMKL